MSVPLTNNFFLNARGFTFQDTASVTWTFDKNLNQLTAAVVGTPSGANPTASAGLAAVNGTALTFMTSDSAPPLDQGISPTMTGTWVWKAASGNTKLAAQAATTATFGIFQVSDSTATRRLEMVYCGSATVGAYGAAAGTCVINAQGGLTVSINDAKAFSVAVGGAVTFASTLAINAGTPTAALSGFGSPSGTPTASLTNAATLAQTAGTLAALLAYLKTIGFIAS